jgi:predicted transcriptional regulator of viral defense system
VKVNAISGLPTVFRYQDAAQAGVSDHRLRVMLATGMIERVARGLYRQAVDAAELADLDLIEIAQRAPQATVCLVSALAQHGLTDQIPARIDIALPRGERTKTVTAPVTWHRFAAETFDVGREEISVGSDTLIGLYAPERCLIDMFRLRHKEGTDVAIEALKAWLRRPGAQPGQLMAMADSFPHAVTPLRGALEILL